MCTQPHASNPWVHLGDPNQEPLNQTNRLFQAVSRHSSTEVTAPYSCMPSLPLKLKVEAIHLKCHGFKKSLLEINWDRKNWYTSAPASPRHCKLFKADSEEQSKSVGSKLLTVLSYNHIRPSLWTSPKRSCSGLALECKWPSQPQQNHCNIIHRTRTVLPLTVLASVTVCVRYKKNRISFKMLKFGFHTAQWRLKLMGILKFDWERQAEKHAASQPGPCASAPGFTLARSKRQISFFPLLCSNQILTLKTYMLS